MLKKNDIVADQRFDIAQAAYLFQARLMLLSQYQISQREIKRSNRRVSTERYLNKVKRELFEYLYGDLRDELSGLRSKLQWAMNKRGPGEYDEVIKAFEPVMEMLQRSFDESVLA